MSNAGELAARVLQLVSGGSLVPLSDQMRLRYLAPRDEVTLPLEELARRILSREAESG